MQAGAARNPWLHPSWYDYTVKCPVCASRVTFLPEIEMWLHPLWVGAQLLTLSLFLRADLCIDVPLEETYLETCADQRLAVA